MPTSYEVVEIGGLLAPRFVEGGHNPDFGHGFSNCTHFQAYGWFWLSFIQRAWRVADEKNEKKTEERIWGKT